ncbi:MAG: hypothetical protein V4447_10995 [Pseudomonadota bacterium]
MIDKIPACQHGKASINKKSVVSFVKRNCVKTDAGKTRTIKINPGKYHQLQIAVNQICTIVILSDHGRTQKIQTSLRN